MATSISTSQKATKKTQFMTHVCGVLVSVSVIVLHALPEI